MSAVSPLISPSDLIGWVTQVAVSESVLRRSVCLIRCPYELREKGTTTAGPTTDGRQGSQRDSERPITGETANAQSQERQRDRETERQRDRGGHRDTLCQSTYERAGERRNSFSGRSPRRTQFDFSSLVAKWLMTGRLSGVESTKEMGSSYRYSSTRTTSMATFRTSSELAVSVGDTNKA